jgi:predicted dehydrogenase
MLKFGLLGAGFAGRVHAAALAQIGGVQLVAIADANAQAASDLATVHHARVYEDIQDLIDDPDVEVVDVCLPTFLHEQCVTLAAAAGNHILCEKPLALSRAEADRMAEAVRSAGVHFMVAQVLRFWPEYTVIKGLLDNQVLGQPLIAYAARLEEPRQADWLSDPALSGGAALDLHVHDLDFLYSLFGLPQAVYAIGQQSKTGAWDHLFTSLDFGNVKGVAEASYMMPKRHPLSVEFRLVCTEGSVEYRSRSVGGDEIREQTLSELIMYRPNQPPEYLDKPDANGYLAEIEYFVNALNQDSVPPIATMAEALDVLDIAMAVQESLTSGRVIQFDMKEE